MEATAKKSTDASGRNVPWGPLAAIVVTVVTYFVAQICAGVFIAFYPSIRGWTRGQADVWLRQSVDAQFLAIAITEAVTVWLLWKFLQSRKATWANIGLIRPRLRDILVAAKGYAVYFVCFLSLTVFIEKFLPSINLEQEQQIGFDKAGNTAPELLAIFFSLVILPPLVEEIVCRGFLYTGLRSKMSVIWAALITSTLFAAAHLQFGSGSQPLWIAAIDTFVLSLILVYARQKTGSLWPAIYIHMGKNMAAFLLLFVFRIA
jgi:membrane protease YdiL (CAAX protease family)